MNHPVQQTRFAREEFEKTVSSAIHTRKSEGHQHWEKPSEVEINSKHITMYDYGCAVDIGYYQCRLIATYDEYFIYLRSGISDSEIVGITYETFNELLKKIDEKMSTCYVP